MLPEPGSDAGSAREAYLFALPPRSHGQQIEVVLLLASKSINYIEKLDELERELKSEGIASKKIRNNEQKEITLRFPSSTSSVPLFLTAKPSMLAMASNLAATRQIFAPQMKNLTANSDFRKLLKRSPKRSEHFAWAYLRTDATLAATKSASKKSGASLVQPDTFPVSGAFLRRGYRSALKDELVLAFQEKRLYSIRC